MNRKSTVDPKPKYNKKPACVAVTAALQKVLTVQIPSSALSYNYCIPPLFMESVLGKEMKDNYNHSYMGQKRLFGVFFVMDSSQIDAVSYTNDMRIFPEVKAYMCERIGKKIDMTENRLTKAKEQLSDPAGLYFDDCSDGW